MAGPRTSSRSILYIVLGALYIILISCNNSVQSRRVTFASNNPKYDVLEGDTIQLVCEQRTSSINIELADIDTNVIYRSNRTKYTPEIFSFSEWDTTSTTSGILTITNITRWFGKKYICKRDAPEMNRKSLTLNVIYKPSNITPACTSNYSFDNIGYDTHGDFYFTCTTEEANPRMQMSMFIYSENGTKRNVTNYAEPSNITLSYQFNQSFISNRSMFVCEASQEFSTPYEDHTYTQHCSLYGSVPSFSVTIEPFNPTVDHGESITLTCASNISGILLEWTGVPDNCVGSNGVNYATNLTMTCSGSLENAKFDVNCTGSYRGITAFNSSSISVHVRSLKFGTKQDQTRPNRYFKWGVITFIVGMILICVILICVVPRVLAFQSKRERHSTKSNHTTTEPHNVNENNSNDSPHHTEGTTENTPRMDEGYDSSQTGMEENLIYEPYTEKNPTYPGCLSNTTASNLDETSSMIDNMIPREPPMAAMSANTAEGCHYESI